MPDPLTRARRALEAGRPAEAETLCRELLAAEPGRAAALALLGEATLKAGRSAEAAELLGRAAKVAPEDPQIHFQLAMAQLAQRQFEAAAAAFGRALSLRPDFAEAAFGRGMSLEARGLAADAVAAYRTAAALKPDFPEAHNNLGAALLRLERPAEALAAFDAALAGRPDFLPARFNRATANYALRRLAAAEADLRFVLARQPGQAAALSELGRVLLKQTRLREAAEIFREGRRHHPGDARFPVNLAGTLEMMNDLEGAEAAARAALALEPEAPALLYTLASLEHRLGRHESARRRLEGLLDRPLGDEQRGEALLELGLVLDALEESGPAFRAIAAGNAIRSRSPAARQADGKRFLARVARARAWATPERLSALAAQAPAAGRPAPVFFVGFPRSGTTLLERALKAHPGIVTSDERSPLTPLAGELAGEPSAGGTYPEALDGLSASAAGILRQRFWAEAAARLGDLGDRILVDKMPLNLVDLGLARRLFPDAPVLIALRDPRDACLSCFMQRFQFNDAMANFFALESTAEAYAAVMGLWLQLRDALAPPWREVRYENLVEDFEAEVRGVLDFIGAGWHPEVAAYREKAARQVITTPSYRQVTGAVHGRAAGRWRRYRTELEPILETLAPFVQAFGYPADSR